MSQVVKEVTTSFQVAYEEDNYCMCPPLMLTEEYVSVIIYDGELGSSILRKLREKIPDTKIKYIHPISPKTRVTTDGKVLYINSDGRGEYVRIHPLVVIV